MSRNADHIFVASFFLLVLLSGCHRTEETFWENGVKKSEISYRGKEYHGVSTWWYTNGNKQMEAVYVHNQLEGRSVRWYFNGHREIETDYFKDKKNGLSTSWDEDGNRISEEHYESDTLHGPYTAWFPNGQVKITGYFDRGHFDSTWLYFNEYGIRVGEGVFDKGSGKQTGFSASGQVMREINYKNSMKHGNEIWYDGHGHVENILVFENDQLVTEKKVE